MPRLRARSSEDSSRSDTQQRVALIVEDDRFVAEVLDEMLRDLGYGDVWQARTESEALGILERESPDVAIVDTNLFGIPSYRVANRLQEDEVPFIVVTGYDPGKLPTAFAAATILSKPVSQVDLAAALSRVLTQD